MASAAILAISGALLLMLFSGAKGLKRAMMKRRSFQPQRLS